MRKGTIKNTWKTYLVEIECPECVMYFDENFFETTGLHMVTCPDCKETLRIDLDEWQEQKKKGQA